MNHLGTVIIETERLVLRRFDESDVEAMFHNWASNDEVTKYLTWPTHSSIEITKRVLEEWMKSYNDSKYYHWAIVPKGNDNNPVGSISVVHMNEDIGMMHIGYCIGEKYWKQGITSEAFEGVISFCLRRLG